MKLDPEKLKQKIQNTRPTEMGVRQQREHKLLLEQVAAARPRGWRTNLDGHSTQRRILVS